MDTKSYCLAHPAMAEAYEQTLRRIGASTTWPELLAAARRLEATACELGLLATGECLDLSGDLLLHQQARLYAGVDKVLHGLGHGAR